MSLIRTLALVAVCVMAVLASSVRATDEVALPANALVAPLDSPTWIPAAHVSRFEHEPEYYSEEPRFAEQVTTTTTTTTPTAASSSVAAAAAPIDPATLPADWNAYPTPLHSDIEGTPGYALKPGATRAPRHYFPPALPVRFPSHPYDNPTYSPTPSYQPVRLPPPWRSDELNTNSDGGRYLRNMNVFDAYPTTGAAAASAATSAIVK